MSKGGVLKLRCEKNDDVCCVDLFKRSFPLMKGTVSVQPLFQCELEFHCFVSRRLWTLCFIAVKNIFLQDMIYAEIYISFKRADGERFFILYGLHLKYCFFSPSFFYFNCGS